MKFSNLKHLTCDMRDKSTLINQPRQGLTKCCFCGSEFPVKGDENHTVTKERL